MWCWTWHTIWCVWFLKQVAESVALGVDHVLRRFTCQLASDGIHVFKKKLCAGVFNPLPLRIWGFGVMIDVGCVYMEDDGVRCTCTTWCVWSLKQVSKLIRRSFALGSHWNVVNSSVGHLMRSMFWENLCPEGVNPCPYGCEILGVRIGVGSVYIEGDGVTCGWHQCEMQLIDFNGRMAFR
jgi:hypothetical protein